MNPFDGAHAPYVDLNSLATAYGTPLYVYSADGFIASYQGFAASLLALDSHIHFAVKANSALGVLQVLAKQGAGADIVSYGEMKRAMMAGIPPEKIVFSGVGKTDAELASALTDGIGQINAESSAEIDHIMRIAEQLDVIAPVCLRVNVNVDPKSHAKISTGQRSTKFGIPVDDGQAKILYKAICQNPHIKPMGLAVHIGSQLTELEPFETAYLELLGLADRLRADGYDVPGLDLGGGLGIDYATNQPVDFASYGRLVTRIFSNRGYRLGFEPGRSIAADNGVLLTKTIFVKDGGDKRFVIVDAAMNDLLRPTLYEAYHTIDCLSPRDPHPLPADIVGPVCETGDYLGLGRTLPDVQEGDILVVRSAGAYGAVMMSNYNTRPEAAEILLDGDKVHVLRPRRTLDELLALEHLPL